MENKFEKMDEWMMKASRGIREDKIPKKELDIFHEAVMKKIIAQQSFGGGLPHAGLIFAAVFSLAVLFGAGFYLYQVRLVKPDEKPIQAEVIRVTAPRIPDTVSFQREAAPLRVSPPVPVLAPAFTEEDILLEIEALKELGVWTEEDEEEAGIPIETAFSELENYVGENQPPMVIAQTARS